MARVVIEFKKSDLKKSYVVPNDCPIFSAMKRAGVPATCVQPGGWVDQLSNFFPFTKKLRVVSNFLAATNYGPRLRDRSKLLGKRFLVTW